MKNTVLSFKGIISFFDGVPVFPDSDLTFCKLTCSNQSAAGGEEHSLVGYYQNNTSGIAAGA